MKRIFKLKNIGTTITILFFLLLLYFIFAPFTFNVERQFTAYKAHMLTPENAEEITVRLSGQQSLCLFRGNHFTGFLFIYNYEMTRYGANFRVSRGFDVLQYIREAPDVGGFDTLVFGNISSDFWLRNIDIIVHNRIDESDWQSGYVDTQGDNNIFIAASTNQDIDLMKRYNTLINALRESIE